MHVFQKSKEDSPDDKNDEATHLLEEPVKLAILYDESNPPSRDVMVSFLVDCCDKMTKEEFMQVIIDKATLTGEGLHIAAMEFQRDELEFRYQIERNYGSRYLGTIPNSFPDDAELINLGASFVFHAMQFYVSAVKLRGKKFVGKLKKSGGMNATQIHEFLEACNALMVMPDTKQILKEVYESTGKPPNEKVIDLQRSMLSNLGFDPDYGVSCLNRIATNFPDDRSLAMKVNQFAMAAQVACKEATFSEEDRKKFYADMPAFMHYCPHLFVMQQQMAMQKEMMRRQQEEREAMMLRASLAGKGSTSADGACADTGHDHEHPHSHMSQEHPAVMMQQMLNSNPEGKELMEELSKRIDRCRLGVEDRIRGWTSTERKNFFEAFSASPILKQVNECGADPMQRLRLFMKLSDEEMVQVMTLQAIVAEDLHKTGGEVLGLSGMRAAHVRAMSSGGVGSAGGAESTSPQKQSGGMLGGIFSALGSLVGANKAGAPQVDAGHSHGHHEHGPHCNHGPRKESTPDVITGKTEQMDR